MVSKFKFIDEKVSSAGGQDKCKNEKVTSVGCRDKTRIEKVTSVGGLNESRADKVTSVSGEFDSRADSVSGEDKSMVCIEKKNFYFFIKYHHSSVCPTLKAKISD